MPKRLPSSHGYLALTASILVCAIWTFWAGKELGWDILNHHVYLPFSWVSGRINVDLFAAGPQSYQNPLGYLPVYPLIAHGAPSWTVGLALAVLHAIPIALTWKLAHLYWAREPHAGLYAAISAIAAALTPVFLQVAGTTSIDPLGAALALGALVCVQTPTKPRFNSLVAGALVGAAFAIKQSNAVFGLAIGGLMLWQVATGRRQWRDVLAFSLAALGSVIVFAGWWMLNLWNQFQSPIFPLSNNIFRSPYAPTEGLVSSRFVPRELYEYVSRFWEFAIFKRYVYVESFAPDIRPALLLALMCGGLFLLVKGSLPGVNKKIESNGQVASDIDRDTLIFASLAYVLWQMTSGNGRYAVALFMLFAVLTVRWAYLLLPRRWFWIVVIVSNVAQTVYFFRDADIRQSASDWGAGPYLEVEVPNRLKEQPYLHLTINMLTNASIAPFLNSAGAMSNIIGQVSLPTQGPVGERLNSLLQVWHGKTRILVEGGSVDLSAREKFEPLFPVMLARFGLDIDWSDCETIRLGIGGRGASASGEAAKKRLLSCAVKYPREIKNDPAPDQQDAEEIFSRVEQACPRIYGPRPFVTEQGIDMWQRYYANSDTVLTASKKDGIIAQNPRNFTQRYIGGFDSIKSGDAVILCRNWAMQTPD